ncbi:hypothetical protein QMK61_03835 [Fulvimonas sp. R45]|uniref:hypothetical protein n=1 Tax=Fulvimonas sp. R45 TaxID=3045937 RepID=UPI00265D69B2|nr:hypothetical protein [Fulvimonas sp. R45]MDO1527955.1 hypothetical protein [Fulvimonas sp. R45]
MKRRPHLWLVACTMVCVLAIGLPYALTPYGKLNLPGALFPGLWLAGAGAFVLAALQAGALRGMLALGAIAPLVAWLRVLVDAARDPTSHNLWPFEIAIAVGASLACVLPGAALGMLVARLRQR